MVGPRMHKGMGTALLECIILLVVAIVAAVPIKLPARMEVMHIPKGRINVVREAMHREQMLT
jgi:magnesium-transporting ATPase (P-type)